MDKIKKEIEKRAPEEDAYIELFYEWDEEDFNERYIGQFKSDEDMARYILDEEPVSIPTYIKVDIEVTANNLMSSEYKEYDRYYFRTY